MACGKPVIFSTPWAITIVPGYFLTKTTFSRWVATEGEKYDVEYNVKMRDMQVTHISNLHL